MVSSSGVQLLLLAVVTATASARGLGCPDPSEYANSSFVIRSLNGFYLGYSANMVSAEVGFFNGTSKAHIKFDWLIERCDHGNTDNYVVKTAGKDGDRYLNCPLAGCFMSSWRPRCSDWAASSWRPRPHGSNCGLELPLLGGDMWLCTPELLGHAWAMTCPGLSLANEMAFLPAECTPVTNSSGKWVPKGFSNVPSTYETEVGVTHTEEKESEAKWAASATASLDGGFNFGSGDVSGTVSHSFAVDYTSVLSMTKVVKQKYELPAGQLWQWVFEFEDRCGRSTAAGRDIALTNGEEPCCLPGFFKVPSEPNGACLRSPDGKLYDICREHSAALVV